MNEKINCLNCGAPLHYDETSYGSTAKCKFCYTEYHIDKLGMVEEYKVKLKMHGKIISFYIGCEEFEPQMIDTTYIGSDGRTYISAGPPHITLTLHSYDMEDTEE
jgi:hypothetical protein